MNGWPEVFELCPLCDEVWNNPPLGGSRIPGTPPPYALLNHLEQDHDVLLSRSRLDKPGNRSCPVCYSFYSPDPTWDPIFAHYQTHDYDQWVSALVLEYLGRVKG